MKYKRCAKKVCDYTVHQSHIGGIMVIVLAASAVDRGFEPQSGQTKDYKNGICCFSTKHAAAQSGPHHHFIEN